MELIRKDLFEDVNVTFRNEENVTFLKQTEKPQTPKLKPKQLKVLMKGRSLKLDDSMVVHVLVHKQWDIVSEVICP